MKNQFIMDVSPPEGLCLNLDAVERLRVKGGKATGRCPACAEQNQDRAGRHFFAYLQTGRFGCVKDRDHTSRIWRLIGRPLEKPARTPGHLKKIREARMAEAKEKRHRTAIQKAAEAKRAEIQSEYCWPLADVWEASPVRLEHGHEADDWRHLVRLFPSERLLWCGGVYDSGPGLGEGHFLTRETLLAMPAPPGDRLAPSTFKAGPSRTLEAVSVNPFAILEADKAIGREPATEAEKLENKLATLALVNWLVRAVGWQLAAIVDTGNKSLHAWFKHPGHDAVEELAAAGTPWGVDAGCLRGPALPMRLPGCIHTKTGKPAQLIFCALPEGGAA